MIRYTLQERIEIIKIHYKNGENLAKVFKTGTFLGRREAHCRNAIKKLVEKFELLGQVSDVGNKTRGRRSRRAENIAAVAESVEETPGLSTTRLSLELGIPQTLSWPKLDSNTFLLWGYVKEKVYANSPASIQDLKDGIREAIEGIEQPLWDLVM